MNNVAVRAFPWRTLLMIILGLVAALALSACASPVSGDEQSEGEDSAYSEYVEGDLSADSEWFTLEEIADWADGMFIMSAEGKFKQIYPEAQRLGSIVEDNGFGKCIIAAPEPTTINQSDGENLVFFGELDFRKSFDFSLGSGYCMAPGVENEPYKYAEIDGKEIKGTLDDANEFAMKSCFSAEEKLLSYNAISGTHVHLLTSTEKGKVISAAWYEGTRWQEGVLDFDWEYCLVQDKNDSDRRENDIQWEPTKKGYSILGGGSLKKGKYCTYNDYRVDHYMIEVI